MQASSISYPPVASGGRTIFSMALDLRPRSMQAKMRARMQPYQEKIRRSATKRFAGPMVSEGLLYSRLVWLHRGKQQAGDVDNIVKPILDALKGVIYADDLLVSQSLATRIDVELNRDLEIVTAHSISVDVSSLLD
jgi:crossover junction endodeoxyribonuclease RusA